MLHSPKPTHIQSPKNPKKKFDPISKMFNQQIDNLALFINDSLSPLPSPTKKIPKLASIFAAKMAPLPFLSITRKTSRPLSESSLRHFFPASKQKRFARFFRLKRFSRFKTKTLCPLETRFPHH